MAIVIPNISDHSQCDAALEWLMQKGIMEDVYTIADYPFSQNLQNTHDQESRVLVDAQKILFIGSGPLPLSAYLFLVKGVQVDLVDYDQPSLEAGIALLAKHGYTVQGYSDDARVLSSAVTTNAYDAIILAVMVGESVSEKIAIVQNIQAKFPDTLLIVRGAKEAYAEHHPVLVEIAKSISGRYIPVPLPATIDILVTVGH